MPTTFEYGVSRLRELKVHTTPDKMGKPSVDYVTIGGRPVKPTSRFWWSLQVRFGFTQNIFKYFSHEEVFQRISNKAPNDELRWCLENDHESELPQLLAVSNPRAAVIRHDDLQHLLGKFGNDEVRYAYGIVRSTHTPRYATPFQIAGDAFAFKFVIDTPIDGFGRPSVYLSMLRLICSNGAVAFAPTFRSELNIGKGADSPCFALVRALEGFNNEEGFAALRQRFDSATRSWASVYEVNRLYKLLLRLVHAKQLGVTAPLPAKGGDGASELDGRSLFQRFHRLSGNLPEIYAIANLDSISMKRQRTLPAGCRVYDLLNFSTELATHHATEVGGRQLQAFIGHWLSGEYDLEGTADQFASWQDFFIDQSKIVRDQVGARRR